MQNWENNEYSTSAAEPKNSEEKWHMSQWNKTEAVFF